MDSSDTLPGRSVDQWNGGEMQVRVDSRTLSRKGDPCCSLKAPYAMSYQAPH